MANFDLSGFSLEGEQPSKLSSTDTTGGGFDLSGFSGPDAAGQSRKAVSEESGPTLGSIAKQTALGLPRGLVENAGNIYDAANPVPLVRHIIQRATASSDQEREASRRQFAETSFGTGEHLREAVGLEGDLAPKNAAERIASSVGSALPFGLYGAGRELAGNLFVQGAAGGTGQLAQEMVPDEYKPIAGIVGGMTGGAGAAGTLALGTTAGRMGRALAEPFTTSGQRRMAATTIRGASENPELLQQTLGTANPGIVPGSEPTSFQLTGDMGIGALERRIETANPIEFQNRRADQNQARRQALEDVRGPGESSDVVGSLRERLAHLDEEADREGVELAGQAHQETTRLGGEGGTTDQHGATMRQSITDAENRARENERYLWQGIDPNNNLQFFMAPIRRAYNRVYGGLTNIAEAGLTPAERQIGEVIGGYADIHPFREVTGLRSAVSSAMRSELYTNGMSPAYSRLREFRGALQDAIPTGVPTQSIVDRLSEATAATRQRAETFNAKPISQIRRREGQSGPFIMQESAIPRQIFHSGPTAYDDINAFRRAVGDDVAGQVLQDYAAHSARTESGAFLNDGTVNPVALDRWVARNADALRAIDEMAPGYSATFRNISDAHEAVANAAARRRDALDAYQRGIVGRLIGANEPAEVDRILGGVFGSSTGIGDMRRIVSQVGGDQAARDGLRATIADYITRRFVSNTEAATSGQAIIKSDQFQSFVRNNQPILRQVFDQDQLNALQAVADDLQRSNRSINAVKLPGRSNTAQDVVAQAGGRSMLSDMLTNAATTMTGVFGSGPLGAIPGWLIGGVINRARDAGFRNSDQIVREAILDPRIMRDLLQTVTPRNANYASQRLARRLTASSVYSGVK